MIILYYAFLILKIICEICWVTAGVLPAQRQKEELALSSHLSWITETWTSWGQETLELLLGRNKMQQILRDLQVHGFKEWQKRERLKDRGKAEEKRARNPFEQKKWVQSINKALTKTQKQISAAIESTAAELSTLHLMPFFLLLFYFITLWRHAPNDCSKHKSWLLQTPNTNHFYCFTLLLFDSMYQTTAPNTNLFISAMQCWVHA